MKQEKKKTEAQKELDRVAEKPMSDDLKAVIKQKQADSQREIKK